MLNRIVLIGRLTRDPEIRYTQSGVAVASFTLAVDRNYKSASGERETDFIDVVAWRQQAELCQKYLTKGNLVGVEGSLQIRSYEGKDGIKRKAAEVQLDNIQFLTPKGSGEGRRFDSDDNRQPPPPSGPKGPFDDGDTDGAIPSSIAEDDLPF